MNNAKALKYYDDLSLKINSPLAIRNKARDTTLFDFQFVKQFIQDHNSILDLGSGTGLLVNLLAESCLKIDAVEKYVEFAKYIKRDENIQVVIADVLEFETDKRYDIVLAFGLMNFFSAEEALAIYKKSIKWLNPGAKFIVKHQMGLSADVVINGFSEELDTYYFSHYRKLEAEISLLTEAGYRLTLAHDIYDDSVNRWNNTRFYALVSCV